MKKNKILVLLMSFVLGFLVSCSSPAGAGGSDPANQPGAGIETVQKPIFNVYGEVDFNDTVIITCPTDGASIFYTTDGSEPTAESSTYTDPILITGACTIKAIASKDGMNPSEVEAKSYSIKTYSINFMTDYGTKPETLLKHKGEKFNFPEIKADYYVLQKWSLDGKDYSIGEEFKVETSDLTFTASWIPVSGSIKITVQEGNDFAVTKTENNESVTLTAEDGYSDIKWYLDGSMNAVSNESAYTFTPSQDVTMVYVTAKKDGVQYSATIHISKIK
ncbi:MAG: chitobiase/beta-hexosaminidase C-terminal domain-containing protein [Treponema sp.]|nr:chitobiase/beta-hexosaminidase C-terminal domain-containing protein [Candidatus Treponema merdequi]